MLLWPDIAAQISAFTGTPFAVNKVAAVGGGCINQSYRIESGGQCFFVKLNNAGNLPMFEAEAAGLQEIHNSRTLRVPAPVCWGKNEASAWLVLECLEIGSAGSSGAASLGQGLAAMHRFSSEKFGWVRNNTIGTTPQVNKFSSDWIQFWREHRLGYQLRLAQANGYTRKLQTLGERLLVELTIFFQGRHQFRHCCTVISGAAITLSILPGSQCCSIRQYITATVRQILP